MPPDLGDFVAPVNGKDECATVVRFPLQSSESERLILIEAIHNY